MAITLLPTPPSRQDPANFNVRADEFLGALPTFGTEANSLASDVNSKQVTASNAATTATNAATTATIKAGEAEASADAADLSAQAANTAKLAAEAALESFDDRYLGAKATDPATDNDGNPLIIGALYFRTTAPVGMKVLTASGWDDAYANLSSKYDKTGGNISGAVTVSGDLLVTGYALGYGVGAGGAVTQATSKIAAVTLNKPSGYITTVAGSIAANAYAAFPVFNSTVGGGDTVTVTLVGGVASGVSYMVDVQGVTAGSFYIIVRNITGAATPAGDAPTIQFNVHKGARS